MLGEDAAALASFLWLIVCVVLVLGLAYWCTRYIAGRGGFGALQGGRRMEVLDRLPLGRDQSVILARVGGRYLLLGAGKRRWALLAELTAEEAASWEPPPAGQEGTGFKEAFLTIMKQKGRR